MIVEQFGREAKMFEDEEIEWSVIDPWWRTYSEHHQEDLKRLHEIMKDLSIAWDVNDSRFNRDPLAVDWTESSPHTGPLQTNQEENWSDWLAHLLRASSGQFIEELLQTDLNSAPLSVKREKCFFLEEKTERRADILLYYEDSGISIEVKLDDQHYAKTPHTASLIEGADQRGH